MRILKLALVSIIFAASVVAVRAGGGDDWTVVQATGPMWVQQDNDVQHISLSDGGTVSPGSMLSTGPSARVLLKRGKDLVWVALGYLLLGLGRRPGAPERPRPRSRGPGGPGR